jgi:hypothetical protein
MNDNFFLFITKSDNKLITDKSLLFIHTIHWEQKRRIPGDSGEQREVLLHGRLLLVILAAGAHLPVRESGLHARLEE